MNEENTGLWLRKTGGKNITRIYIFHKSLWRLTDYYIVHALPNVYQHEYKKEWSMMDGELLVLVFDVFG